MLSLSDNNQADVVKAFNSISRYLAALWSPEGKWLTPLALVCDVYCEFVTFPFGILGQVWFLIVSIPDPCFLSYFGFALIRKK